MEHLNLAGWSLRLVEESRVGHLGLVDDDGLPRVLPVTYALHGGLVWSAIDEHKAKTRPGRDLARVRWLRARPRASLTIDVYDDDWERLAWVQLLGEIALRDEPDPGALEALRAKYEPYAQRAPGGPFVRMEVSRASCWRAREEEGA